MKTNSMARTMLLPILMPGDESILPNRFIEPGEERAVKAEVAIAGQAGTSTSVYSQTLAKYGHTEAQSIECALVGSFTAPLSTYWKPETNTKRCLEAGNE